MIERAVVRALKNKHLTHHKGINYKKICGYTQRSKKTEIQCSWKHFFLSECCMAQRLRCLGGRSSVSYKKGINSRFMIVGYWNQQQSNSVNNNEKAEADSQRVQRGKVASSTVNQSRARRQMPRARMLIFRGGWRSLLVLFLRGSPTGIVGQQSSHTVMEKESNCERPGY